MTEMAAATWRDTVRRWCRENDRSQAWICRRAGLSETQFSKQLNGHRQINHHELAALEQAMSVQSGFLTNLPAEGGPC